VDPTISIELHILTEKSKVTQMAPFKSLCSADMTNGPRQITALESSSKSPMDKHLIPKLTGGIIMLFSSVSGVSLMFIIRGTVGPKMSASKIPTLSRAENTPSKLIKTTRKFY
jgi:hypothetical protein